MVAGVGAVGELQALALPQEVDGVLAGGVPAAQGLDANGSRRARAHLAGETTLEEIRFVLFGEPTYRLFEMVNDAVKVKEQMERLKRR